MVSGEQGLPADSGDGSDEQGLPADANSGWGAGGKWRLPAEPSTSGGSGQSRRGGMYPLVPLL